MAFDDPSMDDDLCRILNAHEIVSDGEWSDIWRRAVIGTGRDADDSHRVGWAVGRVCFVERRWFIRPTFLQSPFLASQHSVEVAADDWGGQSGFPAELGIQFIQDLGDQATAMRIVALAAATKPTSATWCVYGHFCVLVSGQVTSHGD